MATSLQQKFIKKWVEPSFWSLINEKITKETSVWPAPNEEDRNGTSITELLATEHEKKHPTTVDRSTFFNYFQHEKQSDLRYVAEMRRLYEQNAIDKMSGDQILAYHVMKGLRNKEVKKSILKEVKAKDTLIDMDVIEQEINVQASVQAFDNFGINPSASSSCNKMQDSDSPDRGKGKGKVKGKGKNGNSDKKDGKKKPEFVDFKKLSGNEKLKAMKQRGYCIACMKKKHENNEECEAKGHKCKKCDKENHLEKCCAFPKSNDNKKD